MRITVITGGRPGARFVRDLVDHASASPTPAEISVIANTGDDISLWGLRMSPDVDAVLAALADEPDDGSDSVARELTALDVGPHDSMDLHWGYASSPTIAGGLVIVQVERIAERGSLNPRDVKIPGALVDCVVVASTPAHHTQSWGSQYNPAMSGEIRQPMSWIDPMPLDPRKVIARRAASIWRAVTRSGSTAFRPNWPKFSSKPPLAAPWMRPLNCLRNLVRLGCNIYFTPAGDQALSRRRPPPPWLSWSVARRSDAIGSCSRISPLKIQTLMPMMP